MKTCTKCKLEQESTRFHKDRNRPDGRYPQCKTCTSAANKIRYDKKMQDYEYRAAHLATTKAWQVANPEKRIATYRRTHLKKYGITLEDYESLLEAQGGKCAICQQYGDHTKMSLAVDHDHSTGKVRGILCGPCNRGLGHFRDNLEYMQAAMDYLKETQ